MNNQYRQKISEIHAPRELIDRTREQVRSAEARAGTPPTGKVLRFPLRRMLAATAAALVLVALASVLWVTQQAPEFAVLSDSAALESTTPQFGLLDPQRRAAEPGQFDEAFGTALSALETEDFAAHITWSPNGDAERGTAAFLWNRISVRVGCGENPLPEALAAEMPKELHGVSIRLAKTEDGETLMAGFLKGDSQWLLTSSELSEKEFARLAVELAGMK